MTQPSQAGFLKRSFKNHFYVQMQLMYKKKIFQISFKNKRKKRRTATKQTKWVF